MYNKLYITDFKLTPSTSLTDATKNTLYKLL